MSSLGNTQHAIRTTVPRKSKAAYFILEGLNSFATVQYLYYLYFFTEKQFGFGTKANLGVAALNGGLMAIGSIFGGRFAQKHGYHTALKVGFVVMMLSLAVGTQVSSAMAHLIVMSAMVLGMCFTWASLEALVSEGEPPGQLEKMVGIYNVVWAGAGAVAYFLGGAILQQWLPGIFYVPIALQGLQLAILFWIERSASSPDLVSENQRAAAPSDKSLQRDQHPAPSQRQLFVRMAWLANPFAYIAINSLVAIVPTLALKFGLSAAMAGFICSTWCFARVAAFLLLRFWPGWHYRFRWLLLAYVSLIAGFVSILLTQSLFWLIMAQVLFGTATGLIYYSSLFYSMDVSETKGEHGGIHEAAIGLGNCVGPAVGAAALQFLPKVSHGAAFAVTMCLLGGLGGLFFIRAAGPSRREKQ